MNWYRSELKSRAKIRLRGNYLAAVVVAFVVTLFSASNTGNSAKDNAVNNAPNNYYMDEIEGLTEQPEDVSPAVGSIELVSKYNVFHVIWSVFSGVTLLVFGIAAILAAIFLGNVLILGGTRFFIENQYGTPGVGTLLYGFRCGYYMNVVKTMFLMNLYIVLWTFLLIIPGIVKSYEYRMVPYILAEHPEMETRQIFALSKEMMMGEKMNVFVLDLSFIPWLLLSSITIGLAGIFYVNPYMQATDAELYAVLAGADEIPESPYKEI